MFQCAAPRPGSERQGITTRPREPPDIKAKPARVCNGDQEPGAPYLLFGEVLLVVPVWRQDRREAPAHRPTAAARYKERNPKRTKESEGKTRREEASNRSQELTETGFKLELGSSENERER